MTASQLAGWYVVNDVVVRANSNDRTELLARLASTDFQSFFGSVHFDRFGRNSARQMPQRQVSDTLGNTMLVYPFVSAAILPMPTFAERVFSPRYFATPAEVAYGACAGVASLASVALLLFLAWNRSHRIVQALHVTLAALLPIGSLLLYWAPLTWSVYDTTHSCAARVPVWALAYLLILAPIFVSSRRMVSIIDHRQLTTPRRVWTIQHASAQALLMAAPQLILAAVWIAVSPFEPAIVVVDPYRPAWNQIVCRCSQNGFVWATLALLIAKLSCCAYYALRLRRIPPRFDLFNNSRHVALLCFLLPTFVAVLVGIDSALPDYQMQRDAAPVKFLLRSFLAFFIASVAQLFYFFDCVVRVWRERTTTTQQPKSAAAHVSTLSPLPTVNHDHVEPASSQRPKSVEAHVSALSPLPTPPPSEVLPNLLAPPNSVAVHLIK